MDQHPIPQNVTGFQFKLIGSMTVKQFGYVAFGVIIATVIYYIPLQDAVSALLKFIFIPLFGSAGAIIAFVPIDGRPIDIMIGNFIQSFFAPNQYIYRKQIKKFSFLSISLPKQYPVLQKNQNIHTVPEKRLDLQKFLVKNNEYKIKNDLDAREAAYLSGLYQVPSLIAVPAPKQTTPNLSSHSEPALPKILEKPIPIVNSSTQIPVHLSEVLAIPKPIHPPPASHVLSVPKEMNKTVGVLVSDTPNVITGIVKDARGNVLQNILVEIKDQKGNPVRAFKTNSFGNFASATPLTPGTYTIMLEDLKKEQSFDTIQITTNNQIMSPIEIISYDKREELRKELFN